MPVRELFRSMMKPAEIGSFAKEVCAAINAIQDCDSHLKTFTDEITGLICSLEKRTGQSIKNALVQPVIDADFERDEIHQNLVRYIRGAQYHPFDKVIADAGEKVYGLLDSHNSRLDKESYAVESHLINALLVDFEKAEYADAIKTLNIGTAVERLKTSQQKFEQLHVEKSKAESTLTLAQITEYTRPISTILQELLQTLNTFERREPSKYSDVVKHINEMILDSNIRVRTRKTRNESASESQTQQSATEQVQAATVSAK